ncbi:MAG: hypothetical protein QOD00_526, partial [Blastocatellia bacterium]|nr:hypothetical protein [Blastocatellia bacterium]
MSELYLNSSAPEHEELSGAPEEEVFVFPLSFAQQRLWFIHRLDPSSAAYNMPFALRLMGQLDVPALEATLNEIVRRHEALRTTFDVLEEQPVQLIASTQSLELALTDLSELPPQKRDTEARRLATEDVLRPFDFSRGPLLRASLLRLSEQEHILSLTMPHIVSDGWSMGVLVREVAALYEAFSKGQASPLPELPVQYADYAVWQREWLQGEVLETELAYWRKQLGGAAQVLELPTDRPRPLVQKFNGAHEALNLSPGLSDALKQLSQREGATLFMTLLAAFQTLLYRYTGQEDILVGTPVANRHQTDAEQLIGLFTNTLVLRTTLDGAWSFRQLLAQVKETCLGALAHQDLPFEKLVEELRPERTRSHSPLFQVMFTSQNTPEDEVTLPGLRIETFNTGTTPALFDLTLNIQETDEKIYASWHYNTDLFDAGTMRRMSENFAALLLSITNAPERLISELPLLALAERQRLLLDWNGTRRDYATDKCFHQLFEEQVERTPDAIAVSDDDGALTYYELNARANGLAHHLRQLGVQTEMRIGLLLERSVRMVAGLLGVLKAGAAFVPIDPQHPVERISLMLEDSESPIVVTEQHLLEKLSHHSALVICLDADEIETGPHSLENPPHDVASENLAYLIYTSGSTGKPKGVLVEHRQLCNTMFAALENFNLGPTDVMSCVAPYTFDIFYFELMTTLLAGAHCLLVQNRDLLDQQRMTRALERATCIQAVPALMRQILNNGRQEGRPREYERIRQVIIGGEAVAPDLLQEMRLAFPHAQLNVLYGPTEATIFCSRYAVSNVEELERQMIGTPLGNMRLYLCDAHGNLVPTGAAGEICIGGAGVARGYLNRPELTAAKFVPDPFSTEAGARLYRSGDIGRRLPDENIEYFRRIDEQVKVRGWRVEPGEVEAALASHPSVRECVVIVREDRLGDQRLVAYLVVEKTASLISAGEIRSLLKERLPEYMIPSAFVFLDQLPLTPNGKVDRRALPAPDAARPELQDQFIAPRTPTEERLAAIFAQVLGLKEVGASDNFFELGGHSLLATQVISRISEAFQVEMPLDSIFESPTLKEMAGRIDALLGAGNYAKPSRLKRAERTAPLPLSHAQQRLWFIHQLEPASPAYNIPLAVRLTGHLNLNALTQTFNHIIRRHESLRTTFSVINAQPVQLIHSPYPLHLPLIDLSPLDQDEREREAQRLAATEAREPFDLAVGPLMRAGLVRLSEDEHVLLVTMHHIVSDGWSMGVMVREVGELYESYSEGRESEIEELEVQYGDYAVWQRERLQGEV